MLILKYDKKTKPIALIEEQLKELSVAFKLKKDDLINVPILIEGKKEIMGLEKINAHLEELAIELMRERNHAC